MITAVMPDAEFVFDIDLDVVSVFVFVVATEMTCIFSVTSRRDQ